MNSSSDRPLAIAKKRIVLPAVTAQPVSDARPPIPAPVTIRARGVLANTSGVLTPPHAQSPKVERIRVLNANVQSVGGQAICGRDGIKEESSSTSASNMRPKQQQGPSNFSTREAADEYDGDSSFSEEEVLDELDSVVRSQKNATSRHYARDDDDNDDDDDEIAAQLRAIDGCGNDAGKRKKQSQQGPDELQLQRQQELQQEEDAAAEAFGPLITEELLRNKTGYDDLHLVTSTELRIDAAAATGAYLISEKLVALVELRLTGSNVPCVRLLGTKFANLRVLWLNNCQLKDLSGIRLCPRLQELYIAFNGVDMLDELGFLDDLQVLDAEANNICSASQVEFLQPLKKLRHVTLAGNPFIEKTFMSYRLYRVKVKELLSQLETLDDVSTSVPDEIPQSTTTTAAVNRSLRGDDDADGDEGDQGHANSRSCGQSADRSDTASTSAASLSRFVDPLALADELMLVHASIRASTNNALDAMVEEQHRPLYSRQSTSCSGARKRTAPAATSAPSGAQRIPPAPSAGAATSRPAVSSAPAEGKPGGGDKQASSSALTSGKAFTGSLTRNLRAHRSTGQQQQAAGSSGPAVGLGQRRSSAPTLAPQPVMKKHQSSLTVLDGGSSVSSTPVALRSSESASQPDDSTDDVVDETERSAATAKATTPARRPISASQAETLAQALERTPTFALAGDDDELLPPATNPDEDETSPARCGSRHTKNAASELLRKYGHLLSCSKDSSATSSSGPTSEVAAPESNHISVREVVAAVVKQKTSTANAVKESLMTGRKNFESLALSDLGGDEDDVL